MAGRSITGVAQVTPSPETPTPTGAPPGTQESGLGQVIPDTVASLPGFKYVVALLIVVAGWYGARLIVALLARPVAKRFDRPSITQTVLRLIRILILIIALFVAAGQFGFRPTDILLSVTVFSAVLGIVLAPIVGSILNGFFVLADRPYEIGDMIELADRGQRGYVDDITLRYTKMFTLDNTFLVIPNSTIRERDVINYSAEDERVRLSIPMVVTYEGDLDAAIDIMETAAKEIEAVITGGPDIRIGSARYPAAPTCYIDAFGDHGVELTLRYWAKEPYKIKTVQSAVQERVWEGLEGADVEIAYPHSHLVFDDTSGEARVSMASGGHRSSETDSTGGVTDSPDR